MMELAIIALDLPELSERDIQYLRQRHSEERPAVAEAYFQWPLTEKEP